MVDSLSSQMISTQYLTGIVDGNTNVNPNGTETVNKINQAKMKVDETVSKKQVKDVVEVLNKFLKPTNTSLQFKYHEELKEYYAQIVDINTNQIIGEIPPKKLLDAYASMLEYVGLLVDKKI